MQANMSVVKSSKVEKFIKSSVIVGVVKKSFKPSKNIKSANCCGNFCGDKMTNMIRGTTTMMLHRTL